MGCSANYDNNNAFKHPKLRHLVHDVGQFSQVFERLMRLDAVQFYQFLVEDFLALPSSQ